MHMRVQRARRKDLLFPSHHLGGDTDDHIFIHPRHNIGIARFPDTDDAPGLDTDIGLEDAGVIEYKRISDHQVQDLFLACAALLPHSVAQHFSAAELAFFPVNGKVFLDFNHQIGIAQSDPVTRRWTVHIRISASINIHRHTLLIRP